MAQLSFAHIIAHVGGLQNAGPQASSVLLSDVCLSSTQVTQGALFIAISGALKDGHEFIPDAIAKGATALLTNRPVKVPPHVAVAQVQDTREAVSKLAALWFEHPSRAMKVVGITGTNGKTTTNWMLYHAFNRLRAPCVRVGTLGIAYEAGPPETSIRTTPDAIALHRALAMARSQGCQSAVLEVSSHALDQRRADDIEFDVAVFTNLTRDHLDYHKTLDDYFAAKARLFDLLRASSKPAPTAVIGIDDTYGATLACRMRANGVPTLSFGFDSSADIRICAHLDTPQESSLTLSFKRSEYKLQSHFLGAHNAQNYAAAFGSLVALGYVPEQVIESFQNIPAVPGRLEKVHNVNPAVYVDYAHTPDALEKALRALRPITSGRLWVVFGCGGDRDPGKRPQMADIAAQLADRVVVTSDNPRTEDPVRIIDGVLGGVYGTRIRAEGIVEPDRRRAIGLALSEAKNGDVFLIAGKGHEDYQIVGATKHHFSDQEEVLKFFKAV